MKYEKLEAKIGNEGRCSLSKGEAATAGGILGAVIGGVAATVVTIWGGYELGSAINNYLGVSPTIARAALDIVTMGIIAGPAYTIGIYGGLATGAGLGALCGGEKKKGKLEEAVEEGKK